MTSFRPETTQLLAALDALSGNRLTRKDDMGLLIDTAVQNDRQQLLNDLSFHAKLVVRTHGIMSRIGKDAEGFENLSREFTSGVERASNMLHTLAHCALPEQRTRIDSTYLQRTPEGLGNLLSLLADLGWYKNWLIDHPEPHTRT